MLLGENIRSIRKKRGLKQIELAEKAGISTSYLCEIENGRTNPSLNTLLKIAQALQVNCAKLLYTSEDT